jgi:hypothetical protein
MVKFGSWHLAAFSNAVFLLYFLNFFLPLNCVLLSTVIVLLLFIAPGISWAAALSPRSPVAGLFFSVCFSTAANLCALALRLAGGFAVSPLFQAACVFAVSNAGYFFVNRKEARFDPKKIILPAILLIAAYSLTFYGMNFVAPPMEDFDFESQATAYALATRLEPEMLTDRRTTMFFAHPPLQNLYTAEAFLFSGKLGGVRYYYDIAARAGVGTGDKKTGTDRLIREEYRFFRGSPFLAETRLPNLFFSSVNILLVFALLAALTGSRSWAFFGAALYFSFPEIFLRGCLGSIEYTSASNFIFLVFLCFYFFGRAEENEEAPFWPVFSAGVFMALLNHKTVILPAALLLRESIISFKTGKTGNIFKNPAVWGFFSGTLAFWAYGLLVNAGEFIRDHLRYHILDRITHAVDLGYYGYPSAGRLWLEFNYSTGFVFLLAAVPSALYLLKDFRKKGSLLPLWFLTGAVAFSLVDWRQTKHLMLVLLPLLLAAVAFAAGSTRKEKPLRARLAGYAAAAALVFVFARNIWVLCRLSADFNFLKLTGGW